MISFYNKFLRPLFFTRRLYAGLVVIAFMFVLSFWFTWLYVVAQIVILFFLVLVLLDYISLFQKTGITIRRDAPEKFSNGDPNKVHLILTNNYSFRVTGTVIDEIPIQFQHRDFRIGLTLKAGETVNAQYELRPVERGEYVFR
ncbi:MAG TPA: DUF58 domain-containing protein, partial [Chitinophagaceae bacterium]